MLRLTRFFHTCWFQSSQLLGISYDMWIIAHETTIWWTRTWISPRTRSSSNSPLRQGAMPIARHKAFFLSGAVQSRGSGWCSKRFCLKIGEPPKKSDGWLPRCHFCGHFQIHPSQQCWPTLFFLENQHQFWTTRWCFNHTKNKFNDPTVSVHVSNNPKPSKMQQNKLRWHPQKPQRFIFTNLSEACRKAKRWKPCWTCWKLTWPCTKDSQNLLWDLLCNLLRNPQSQGTLLRTSPQFLLRHNVY